MNFKCSTFFRPLLLFFLPKVSFLIKLTSPCPLSMKFMPRYISTGLVHSSSPSVQHFNDMSYLRFIQSMGARAYRIDNDILSSIQPSSGWCG